MMAARSSRVSGEAETRLVEFTSDQLPSFNGGWDFRPLRALSAGAARLWSVRTVPEWSRMPLLWHTTRLIEEQA
jgi:hypothetical protein